MIAVAHAYTRITVNKTYPLRT